MVEYHQHHAGRRTLPQPKKLPAPPPTANVIVVVIVIAMSCHVMPCHHAGVCWPLRDGRKDCGDRAESSRIGATPDNPRAVLVFPIVAGAWRRPRKETAVASTVVGEGRADPRLRRHRADGRAA